MVGSLKKGSKQSMSLPSTAYNTLPAHVHHMRSTTSSPRVIAGQQNKKHHHKRSPSSDSGTGSNTPVSSYHSGKVHHTVFLHGKLLGQVIRATLAQLGSPRSLIFWVFCPLTSWLKFLADNVTICERNEIDFYLNFFQHQNRKGWKRRKNFEKINFI